MFTIKSINILPECKYRKNLKPGIYIFDEFTTDFFGSDISLHAIVGKNGSGKSALMELMFRMINNYGAVMCKDVDRNAAENIVYVSGVYADLEFVKTYKEETLMNDDIEKIHHGKLSVRNKNMWLSYDDKLYFLFDCDEMGVDELEPYHEEIEEVKLYGIDLQYILETEGLQKIADIFFYTIATNYSMQGFLASDFDDEDSYEYISVNTKDDKYQALDEEDMPMKMWSETTNWINRLFHKNDGYLCPITLNPYRNGGHIDIDNEMELTMSRLSAMLVIGNEMSILENYSLDELRYEYDSRFYKKFTPIYRKDNDGKNINTLSNGGDLSLFKYMLFVENSFASIILDELDIMYDNNMADVETASRLYVVYKILNIAKKYPQYVRFREIGNVDNAFKVCEDPQEELLKELVSQVKTHNSHIEMKTKQAIGFIQYIDEAKAGGRLNDMRWMMDDFSLSEYVEKLGIELDKHNIERCMMDMPPNLFKQEIYLKRIDRGPHKPHITRNIPFGRLSTGEKQFLCQMSTLVYHLLNLNSVSGDSVKYKDVNIVLDEIEVCFHPEYQRMFVNRLLNLLDRQLGFNTCFNIHIWITTHSPFILSDIPQKCVTYLEDGKWISPKKVAKRGILNPFAANVNDILHQSFFLDKGFMGEFAKNKLISLIGYLKGENNNDGWNKDSALGFIKVMDERLIQRLLSNLYYSKYEKDIDRQ